MLLIAGTDALRGQILRAAGSSRPDDHREPGDDELDLVGDGSAATELLDLLADPDPVVRTGAVLMLPRVISLVGPAAAAASLLRAWPGLVGQPPAGFSGVWARALWGHGVLVLAEHVTSADVDVADMVAEWAEDPELRGPLLVRLARAVPELVCTRGRAWAGPEDTGVLAALPDRACRAWFVKAVAPWPVWCVAPAIESLAAAGVPGEEVDGLAVAMMGRS